MVVRRYTSAASHVQYTDGSILKYGSTYSEALSIIIYSLLNNLKIKNNISITGEINLSGDVLQIGGLSEKLHGCKIAGVNTVLIPKENEKDLLKIKEDNKNLIDDNFEVIMIENFFDACRYAFV